MTFDSDRRLRQLLIEQEYGVWHVGGRGADCSSRSLERALAKAVPDASGEQVCHAATIIAALFRNGSDGRESLLF